jgi:hypothetical protein
VDWLIKTDLFGVLLINLHILLFSRLFGGSDALVVRDHYVEIGVALDYNTSIA